MLRYGFANCWTYIVPDGHDKDHGDGQGLIEGSPASDLSEAVAVTKDLKLVVAEVGSDVAAVWETIVCGRGNYVLDAVLDEELGELVGGELAHDAGGKGVSQ